MRPYTILSAIALTACLTLSSCHDSQPLTELEEGFVTPPAEARPRVWWHWMDGNISKDGAMKDIEWMREVGIGGFHCFDAGISTPQIVEHRVKYMSDEWKDVFAASIAKADEYGMEVGVAASPGWSETGGPWVKPEKAMKKLVWSEADVAGGETFDGVLPHPPVVNGRFQDLNDGGWQEDRYYRDIAVLAFKVKAPSMASLRPKLTCSGGEFTLEQLTNGRISDESELPYLPDGQGAWIQYEFDEPQTIFGADIKCGIWDAGPQRFMLQGEDGTVLEYSSDGVHFETASLLEGKVFNFAALSFRPVTGKYFRLRVIPEEEALRRYYVRSSVHGMCAPEAGRKSVPVAEFNLYGTPRVGRHIEKAGFFPAEDLYKCPSAPAEAACQASEVIDLSALVSPDGSLRWTAPEGCWKILRFGYDLTGHQNSPASAEATGLEVDKMDADAVEEYIEQYLAMYKDAAGGLMGERGIRRIMLDSWEAECQNWTEKMPQEFEKLCGYDILPWLPTIAGYVIGSPESSDRFLWDFRRTIAELIARNHYDKLAQIIESHGLESYMESQELVRAYVADGMRVKKNATIPMCAMWTAPPMNILALGVSGADCRESASVAHIYGKKYVSAESLTTADPAWSSYPGKLKERADLLLANGLNRFIIHECCHQPLDDFKPGFTLGGFGQWFNRHETWAGQAKAWTDYLARSSYMMQQGRNFADILYYYGEDNNLTNLFPYVLPELPQGYNFDFVNADALVNDLSVGRGGFGGRGGSCGRGGRCGFSGRGGRGGRGILGFRGGFRRGAVVSPSGARYRLIVLDPNATMMSLPVLRSLSRLVKAGAVVVGAKPAGTPSLSDDEEEFRALADAMWDGGRRADCGSDDGCSWTRYGKGFVLETALADGSAGSRQALSRAVKEALEICGCAEDVIECAGGMEYKFVHRRVEGRRGALSRRKPAGTEIYWVDNRTAEAADTEFSFNVTGCVPSIWNAVDGSISPASWRIEDGRTTVKLHFEADDALFVVFADGAGCADSWLAGGSERAGAGLEGAAGRAGAGSEEARRAGAGRAGGSRLGRSRRGIAEGKLTRRGLAEGMEIAEPVVCESAVEGAWTLSFPDGMGAPEEVVMETLQDWTLNENKYVRYYSGTGVYRKEITLDAAEVGAFGDSAGAGLGCGGAGQAGLGSGGAGDAGDAGGAGDAGLDSGGAGDGGAGLGCGDAGGAGDGGAGLGCGGMGPGGKVVLCLGSVCNIADVTVNGIKLGTVWKEPWTIDISSAVHSGENTIEIAVTNLWANRLIGDARGDAGTYAHAASVSRRADEELSPSGLLGPVSVLVVR